MPALPRAMASRVARPRAPGRIVSAPRSPRRAARCTAFCATYFCTAGASEAGAAAPLVALEHVNVNVPAWSATHEKFWYKALGFARDPRAKAISETTAAAGGSMKGLEWANIGLQQVHMPLGEAENPAQRVRGTIGFAYNDLDSLRRRLHQHDVDFEEDTGGAAEAWLGPALLLRTPTGQVLRAHENAGPFTPPDSDGADVSLPGGPSLGVGMAYVEFMCGLGTAVGICRFYQEVLGVAAEIAEVGGAAACHVRVARQRLLFQESGVDLPPYDGHHIALYVGDIAKGDARDSFAAMYRRCNASGLVYNNPRFPHLRYDTLDEAVGHGEFRVVSLVDPGTGGEVYRLEHEIRSLEHNGFSCKSLLKPRGVEL